MDGEAFHAVSKSLYHSDENYIHFVTEEEIYKGQELCQKIACLPSYCV